MRTLIRDFSVEDDFRNMSWQSLRPLAKPLARYGRPGSDILDGALFCYVLTTDPEVLLMLEARSGKEGPEWQFAFAPMTIYPVKASHKGREIWSREHRPSGGITAEQPFYVRGFELGE